MPSANNFRQKVQQIVEQIEIETRVPCGNIRSCIKEPFELNKARHDYHRYFDVSKDFCIALHRISSIVLEQVQKMQRQRPICDSIPRYENLSCRFSRRTQLYHCNFLVPIRLSQ